MSYAIISAMLIEINSSAPQLLGSDVLSRPRSFHILSNIPLAINFAIWWYKALEDNTRLDKEHDRAQQNTGIYI
jgi:hypothetical protein